MAKLMRACLLIGLLALPAAGQTSFYSVADGFWHQATTWTNPYQTTAIPGTGDQAFVRHSLVGTQHIVLAGLRLQAATLTLENDVVFTQQGTGTWNGAVLSGAGRFINAGKLVVTGEPSRVALQTFENSGQTEFVDTPSLQIDGRMVNTTSGIIVIFNWRTTNDSPGQLHGTGQVVNAGQMHVQGGTTCGVPVSFHNAGTLMLGTGSHFRTTGGGTWSNAILSLATGSQFHVAGGTNIFYGGIQAHGQGQLWMSTGQITFFRAGMTTGTHLSTESGGFHWQGGTLSAPMPNGELHQNGSLYINGVPGSTQGLQGTLINHGVLHYAGGTDRVFQVAGVISNAPSGTFVLAGTNPVVSSTGPSTFHNSGRVEFNAGGTTAMNMVYFQHGGTTTFQRGSSQLYGAMYGGQLNMNGGTWSGGSSWFMHGGSLGGAGAIGNNVYHESGRISPGTSPGILNIEGMLEQSGETPELFMEVGGTDPGTTHDQITVSETGTFSGVLTVELLDDYAPPPATRIDLVTASGITGHFATTNLPVLPGDHFFVVRYLTNAVQLRVATPSDTDGDGLPDAWELDHFGNQDASDGADDDFDEDGHADAQELIADTDPADANSYLRLLGAEPGPPVMIQFEPGSTGRVYTLFYTDDLAGGEWSVVPGTEPRPGTGGTDAMVDTNVAPTRAFRLHVEWP